jgi:hypothetical protein
VLTVRLTRVSSTHHRLTYLRTDGSGEDILLETKSCILHDLVHFALESEAKLVHSFYGNLARAAKYNEISALVDETTEVGKEIIATERVVGPLTNIADSDPMTLLSVINGIFAAYGEPLPNWCTHDLLIRVQNRVRQLRGQWQGTPFGQSMELYFP